MKLYSLLALSILILFTTGCPTQNDARDAIAVAHGWIVQAQTQWGDSCRLDPTQVKCTTTNRLIAAQHVAADALEIYCSGTPAAGEQPYAVGGTCVPVKSAQNALVAAVGNMNVFTDDVKSLLGRN